MSTESSTYPESENPSMSPATWRRLCFYRSGRFWRDSARDRCVESLTAHHQEFVFTQDGAGGSDRMIKLLAVHTALPNDL